MKHTAAELSLPTDYLDRLSDAEIGELRVAMQNLATHSQRETQRYQRAVAKIDASLQRRAAQARKAA